MPLLDTPIKPVSFTRREGGQGDRLLNKLINSEIREYDIILDRL